MVTPLDRLIEHMKARPDQPLIRLPGGFWVTPDVPIYADGKPHVFWTQSVVREAEAAGLIHFLSPFNGLRGAKAVLASPTDLAVENKRLQARVAELEDQLEACKDDARETAELYQNSNH